MLSKVRKENALFEGLELSKVADDVEGGVSNDKGRKAGWLAFVSLEKADGEFERRTLALAAATYDCLMFSEDLEIVFRGSDCFTVSKSFSNLVLLGGVGGVSVCRLEVLAAAAAAAKSAPDEEVR